MIGTPLTQAQKDGLHALGLTDDDISFFSPEEAEKAIRYLTPALVQEILNDGRTPPTRGPQQEQPPQARETNGGSQPTLGPSGLDHSNTVIHLADRAAETVEITQLEPSNGMFIGKRINPDNSIAQDPKVLLWRWYVARVPATIAHLFAYLRTARQRNICLIRGAPGDLERSARRLKVNFLDLPTYLFWLDCDGAPIAWRDDPERGVRAVIAQLGEPWASTSFVWFLSATCGLERDEDKRWTGRIIDGSLRVRIGFLTERALDEHEAIALTNIAKVRVPEFDLACSRLVQINYITRPVWVEHPGCDVLGNIPTIGWVKGTHDRLAVPDHLMHTARWAHAQGLSSDIADHPDAESAVRGIGSDGAVRSHLKAAVKHLLITNPPPDVVSFDDHSLSIVGKLLTMLERHRTEIHNNLARHRRPWSDVLQYLPDNMIDWSLWLLNHQRALRSKTIKLVKERQTQAEATTSRAAIFARVERVIAAARAEASASQIFRERPPVTLLAAPVGSGKSTRVRAEAVRFVTEQPKKTVVILVPRHKLGDEQIKWLREEHPGGNYVPAVWRGRHAWNPYIGNGCEQKMCVRSEEAEAVEKALLNVENTLCKRGRGDKTIKCPFYDTCAFQQQKQIKANIIFAAHECAVHEMPTVFGDVGWVIFDESPLDAFLFGVDGNDQVEIKLDTLHTPLPVDQTKLGSYLYGTNYGRLMRAREDLYCALDKLRVPIDPHQGIAVPRRDLHLFIGPWPDDDDDSMGYDPKKMRSLTFRGKVTPDIRPDTPKEQLKTELENAAVNSTIKLEVRLWELIDAVGKHELYGRIQVHRDKDGRIIRMVGLEKLVKDWNVPTLICDATGDAELLKAVWSQLLEAEPHGWEQLPRPANVRIVQCVNRTISKWAVAVEGKHQEELERKIEGARRLYAAVLMKALEYGGAEVGVITYKTTRAWVEKNCCVPDWLKLMHWGDVTGTNALQYVRALFVIGRPLASPEDVAQQGEALFGAYIPQRDYVARGKQGRIPIISDVAGNDCIRVDVKEHPHPMGERLRRQITEGAIIQAAGRARAGLRTPTEPLDIHLWTDVPVPELGPVEPVLWSELDGGLDGLMLATKGCRLSNIADAVRAFEGLFTADALKKARARGGGMNEATPALTRVFYQRAGAGCKPTDAMFLKGIVDPRGWLEERLGPLAYFEIEKAA